MELIKGKIYRDTPVKHAKSTYLKFVEYDKEEGFCFEYAGGDNGYLQRESGLIVLSIHIASWPRLVESYHESARGSYIPDRLIDESTTERIKRLVTAFEYDDNAMFMITNAPSTEVFLMPGEIGQCSLRLDDVHYGIPRVNYHTRAGNVTLFPHECMPVTSEDVSLYLKEGYTILSDGRYIPPKESLYEIEAQFGCGVGLLNGWESKYDDLITIKTDNEHAVH